LLIGFKRKSEFAKKTMKLEKDDLEFVLNGLQGVIEFGRVLLQEGSEVEIVSERGKVIERLDNLVVMSEGLTNAAHIEVTGFKVVHKEKLIE
jgi:hypothetical protein